jgi:hypothetical protein
LEGSQMKKETTGECGEMHEKGISLAAVGVK